MAMKWKLPKGLKTVKPVKGEAPYQVFKIPKKSGGFRTIEAPCPSLKAKQRACMFELMFLLKISPFAHAFARQRNIVTMAEHHVKKDYVLAFDLSDYFPSIKKETFLKFLDDHAGKGKKSAEKRKRIEELLECCFHDFKDGKGLRLPQGAPTSPLIANAFLYRFDWRCAWTAFPKDIAFTRYADDLVFSGKDENDLWTCFYAAKHILEGVYNLTVHPKKVRLMGRKRRQMVCGVVVNEKLNLPKRWRKNLRAARFQLKLFNEGRSPNKPWEYGRKLNGRESFINMLNKPKTMKSNLQICRVMDMINKL